MRQSNHMVYVLLSGGIDSTTTLAMAKEDFPNALFTAVTVDYGQRHVKEIRAAKDVVDHYGAEHMLVYAAGLLQGMLVHTEGQTDEPIPDLSYAELDPGISPTYVTFRNGFMLSIVAATAQGWVMAQEKAGVLNAYATIYCGVHADDGAHWAYPDCTPEFIGGMANAIHIGTYQKVRLRAPLLNMSKAAVVRDGTRLKAPLEMTWSCYKGGALHCGTCPTCRSRKEAFKLNDLADPTSYAA